MAYVGNQPAEKYTSLARQTFSSPTGASFVLNYSVTNSDDLLVYVNSVKQDPTSYSATGTSLTLTESLVSGDEMYALFYGRATETVNPPDDSVGLSQMAGGTDGNLITFDASGNPAYVATGSSGQVLTSAGAGAPPTFSAVPAHTGNVAFPATQVASADANTLDDYEEGTFTPTATFGGGFTGWSYGVQHGTYTKIGNMVYFQIHMGLSSAGSSTGNWQIQGLPFASASSPALNSSYAGSAANATTATGGLTFLHSNNTSVLGVYQNGTGDASPLTHSQAGSSTVYCHGHYRV